MESGTPSRLPVQSPDRTHFWRHDPAQSRPQPAAIIAGLGLGDFAFCGHFDSLTRHALDGRCPHGTGEPKAPSHADAIITAGNRRRWNRGARHNPICSPYEIRSVELQYLQRHFDTALSLWCLMDSVPTYSPARYLHLPHRIPALTFASACIEFA